MEGFNFSLNVGLSSEFEPDEISGSKAKDPTFFLGRYRLKNVAKKPNIR